MLTLKKHKKLFITLFIILLLPFILPILEVFIKILLTFGRYIGTNMRFIEEGICLK